MTADTDLFEDELEDFDSEDFVPVASSGHTYLRGMWGGWRDHRQVSEDKATVAAHGMVQSFVNAFARDGRYIVVFDRGTSTAGTDMKAKFVTITPAPILDKKLTADQAAEVLTALAVHEISHPRYGRMTAQAVEKVFPGNGTAARLSNLLDDIRIERRFVADYPGYAGIFEPALDYIGGAGGYNRVPKLSAPVNLAIAATRYPKFSDWSDPALMREYRWWNDWADRWAKEDAPKRHVEAIREALQHVVDIKAKNPPPPPPSTQQPQQGGGGGGGQAGSSQPSEPQDGGEHAEDDAPQDAQPQGAAQDESEGEGASKGMDDTDLNQASMPKPNWYRSTPDDPHSEDDDAPIAACAGSETVDKAANANGVEQRAINTLRNRADNVIEAARNEESDGHGNTVDVNRSLRGITAGGEKGRRSAVAAKYIRNAIMQSRSGHTTHEPYKPHGRLDQRGLHRAATRDYRLFERRKAPSPGRYNIWVMVDMSSSMGGWGSMTGPCVHAAGVAHAMASASLLVHTVRMSVWAWTDAFRPSSNADAGVALAWRTGMNPDQALRLSTVKQGGTPDSTVMGWAARAILKDTRPEEEPVIIFISDGAGWGDMNERVAEAKKMGVAVYSVSFGGGFTGQEQLARFGKGNYIEWAGSIEATARPLAKLFARITGTR